MIEEREEFEQYRIESKRPRSRKWEYIQATNTAAGNIETARRFLEWQRRSTSAGWQFRIVRRNVITITTPWEEVPEEIEKVAPPMVRSTMSSYPLVEQGLSAHGHASSLAEWLTERKDLPVRTLAAELSAASGVRVGKDTVARWVREATT